MDYLALKFHGKTWEFGARKNELSLEMYVIAGDKFIVSKWNTASGANTQKQLSNVDEAREAIAWLMGE